MKNTIRKLPGIAVPHSRRRGLGQRGIAIVAAGFIPVAANAGFTGTGKWNDVSVGGPGGQFTYEDFTLTYDSARSDPTIVTFPVDAIIGLYGPSSLTQTSGTLTINSTTEPPIIGANSATATDSISGGLQTWNSIGGTGGFYIGNNGSSCHATVNVSRGTLTLNAAELSIGRAFGSAAVNITDGTLISSASTVIFNDDAGVGAPGGGAWVVFGLGSGVIELTNLSTLTFVWEPPNDANYFNFLTGSQGQLQINGWSQNQFDALVANGAIRVDGAMAVPSQFVYTTNAAAGVGTYQLAPAGTSERRYPWLWPFATNSPWNMPIGSGAKFASDDDPITKSLQDTNLCGLAVDGKPPAVYLCTNSKASITCHYYSMPVYLAASNDPLRRMQFRDANHHTTTDFHYRIPNRVIPAFPAWNLPATNYYGMGGEADAHMSVVEPGQQYVSETWVTRADPDSPGNWLCACQVQNDLYGSGVGAGGTRAYGGSGIGGLIRAWEIQAGSIRHALCMSFWGTQIGAGPIWPAISEDGPSEYCGHVHQGTLVAILPSVNISNIGLTADGLVLARALQNYGAYLVDCGGGENFYAEPAAEQGPTGPHFENMRADAQKLWRYLRPVTNNSPASIGGGGTPLQPPAPPWAVPKAASSVIPVAYYRLGENDASAIAGKAAGSQITDVINGMSLHQVTVGTGTPPVYGTNTGVDGSSLCLNVDGEGYARTMPFTNGCVSNFVTDGWGIEAWVKAASNAPNPLLASKGLACVVCNGDDGADGLGIYDGMGIFQNSSGQCQALVGQGGWVASVKGPSLAPGVWTHVAVVVDGWSNSTFYVNGIAAGTGPIPYAPTRNFSIGYVPYTGHSEGFQGGIDEVRVFGVLPGRFSTNDLLLAKVPPGP
jgi:hypothetical protein